MQCHIFIFSCFPVILLQLLDFLHCLATGCLLNSKKKAKPRTASNRCAYVVLMSQYWVRFPPFYWLTLRHVGMLLLYQVLILYSSVWPVDVNFILDTADLCRFRLALKTEFPATKGGITSAAPLTVKNLLNMHYSAPSDRVGKTHKSLIHPANIVSHSIVTSHCLCSLQSLTFLCSTRCIYTCVFFSTFTPPSPTPTPNSVSLCPPHPCPGGSINIISSCGAADTLQRAYDK